MSQRYSMEKNTLSQPGRMGRGVRVLGGIAMLAWFASNLRDYEFLTGNEFPVNGTWIGVVIMFYFFGDLFKIGFNRSWGKWPQVVFLFLLAAGVVFNYVDHGGFWGAPTGWLVYLMYMTVAAFIGVSFILGAILVTPG